MTSSFSNELISAYLDGELTAPEQARVEKQLRADAELRRMCDELRALRSTLQALPLADPPENLAERVLRQAERQMLLGSQRVLLGNQKAGDQPTTEPISATAPPTNVHTVEVPQAAALPTWRKWRVAAACVASAAVLLLAVLLTAPPSAKRDVAQSTKSDAADATSDVGQGAEQDDRVVSDNVSSEHIVSELEERGVALDEAVSLGLTDDTHDGVATEDGSAGEDAGNSEITDRKMADREEGVLGGRNISMGEAPRPADDSRPAGPVRRSGIAHGAAGSSAPFGPAAEGSSGTPESPRPALVTPRGRTRSSRSFGYDASGGMSDGYGMGSGHEMEGGAGMGGGMESTSPPQPEGAVPGASKPVDAPRESTTAGRSFSEAQSHTNDPTDTGTLSRSALAQQLVRQLNRDASLLVQISLPDDLHDAFFDLPQVRQEVEFQSRDSAGALLSKESLAPVELRAAMPSDGELYRLNQGVGTTLVIEGAPDDVRKSLKQFVSHTHVQVQPVPAVGSPSLVISPPAAPGQRFNIDASHPRSTASDDTHKSEDKEEHAQSAESSDATMYGREPASPRADSDAAQASPKRGLEREQEQLSRSRRKSKNPARVNRAEVIAKTHKGPVVFHSQAGAKGQAPEKTVRILFRFRTTPAAPATSDPQDGQDE